jgi:hypothetical protein
VPPRFAYWTILIDNAPTAFRSREADELLPTVAQLKRKNANVVLKWFARGRLWESQQEERDDFQRRKLRPRENRRDVPRGDQPERRTKDWRPGGDHKDPRARFSKEKRRAESRERRSDEREKPGGGDPDRKRQDKPWGGKPRSDRPWQGKPKTGDRPGTASHGPATGRGTASPNQINHGATSRSKVIGRGKASQHKAAGRGGTSPSNPIDRGRANPKAIDHGRTSPEAIAPGRTSQRATVRGTASRRIAIGRGRTSHGRATVHLLACRSKAIGPGKVRQLEAISPGATSRRRTDDSSRAPRRGTSPRSAPRGRRRKTPRRNVTHRKTNRIDR